jgi:hypothetical protein
MTPRERLLFLQDALRSPMPPGLRFRMNTWRANLPPGEPDGCGTAACALGYATMLPALAAEGLTWHDTRFMGVVTFGDHVSYGAGEIFFGLDEGQSEYLFDPWAYDCDEGEITPADVAGRIDEVLRVLDETAP